jgi:hypothetical protein
MHLLGAENNDAIIVDVTLRIISLLGIFYEVIRTYSKVPIGTGCFQRVAVVF